MSDRDSVENDWVSVSSSSDMACEVYKRDMIKERTARERFERENAELRATLTQTQAELVATKDKLEITEEERDSIRQMKRSLQAEKEELVEYTDALKRKVAELEKVKAYYDGFRQSNGFRGIPAGSTACD